MKVIVLMARVWGTKDQYGPKPRIRPCPRLSLKDFPKKGYDSHILLGAPSEIILRANKIARALGMAILMRLVGGSAGNKLDLDKEIQKKIISPDNSFARSDHNWYITITSERIVEIPDSQNQGSEYLWIAPEPALELEKKHEVDLKENLDLLTTYLSTHFKQSFFKTLIVEDRLILLAKGKKPLGLPQWGVGNASVSITSTMESLKLDKLHELLTMLRDASEAQHERLKTVKHWRIASLQESDRWKQFQWGFLALEVLTNKLCASLYGSVTESVVLSKDGTDDSAKIAMKSIVIEKGKMSLRSRFAVVALGLSAPSADADMKKFVELKKARDQIAHGHILQPDDLPLVSLNNLLDRYLSLATHYYLTETEAK
jgi:hypothetical protein